MDTFVTANLERGRKNQQSCCLFHFKDMNELYTTQSVVCTNFQNAFQIPPSLQPQNPRSQTMPIGFAWIIIKTDGRKSNYAQDEKFSILISYK